MAWPPASQDPAAVEKLRAGIIRVPALASCCLAAEASASWPDEALAAAVALEGAMQQQDAEEAAKADARNALESFILSVGACHRVTARSYLPPHHRCVYTRWRCRPALCCRLKHEKTAEPENVQKVTM